MTFLYDATTLSEHSLTAGQTLRLDLRAVSYPFGWRATATGAAMTVEASNVADPQSDDDWFAHKVVPTISAGGDEQDAETAPVGWLRWSCGAGGTGKVEIAAKGMIRATVS